jgi:nitroimidazol reductase NimA-like FMN-containing flavoprotein (pyridoxamine 5'-phosphate oxidase superfamily)
MLIHEISREQCIEVITRSSVGRLGCSYNDQPYIVPIYLAYDSDWIYVFSTFGKKIEWMRANPRVCVEFEEAAGSSESLSVIVSGEYQELPEPQFTRERGHARDLLAKKHHWWLNALAERRVSASDQDVEPLFFRIHVDSVTGLRWGT